MLSGHYLLLKIVTEGKHKGKKITGILRLMQLEYVLKKENMNNDEIKNFAKTQEQ